MESTTSTTMDVQQERPQHILPNIVSQADSETFPVSIPERLANLVDGVLVQRFE